MQALLGATLIDGTGRTPVSDVTVVLNDAGRIEEVGPRAAVIIPPGATTYDVTGLTLMPGLIDCHDHLSSHGTSLAERFALAEPISTGHVRTAKVLEQVLRTGYTTVRDGGWLDVGFKQAIEQKLIQGPRLVLATSPISPIGGLADRVSPSGHSCVQPHGYIDPNLPDGVATGTNEVRRKVREMVRAGADVVKFATTGGASSRVGHGPKEVEFDRDEIDMLVQEANALGRRAMCHALGGPGLRMAIEAGVHSIEHGTYLDEDPDLLPMMADKGIFFVPTFTVYVYHGTQGTPHGRVRAQALKEHHAESLRRAVSLGVRVVAGTDAGAWDHPHNAREIECLVDAGMTPMQAIQAATGVAAECLDMQKDIGSVEKGKLADLIAIDGDPLQDVGLLQDASKLRLVMKGGVPVVDHLSGARAPVPVAN